MSNNKKCGIQASIKAYRALVAFSFMFTLFLINLPTITANASENSVEETDESSSEEPPSSFMEDFLIEKNEAINSVIKENQLKVAKQREEIQKRIAKEEKDRRVKAEEKRKEEERKRKEEEERKRQEELARQAELERQRQAELEAQRQAEQQAQQSQQTEQIQIDGNYVKQRICEVFGSECQNALIIAKYESGYRTDAYYLGNYGVFQINCPAHSGKVGGNCNALYDLETNLRVAKQIFDAQGWGPWAVKHHLPGY